MLKMEPMDETHDTSQHELPPADESGERVIPAARSRPLPAQAAEGPHELCASRDDGDAPDVPEQVAEQPGAGPSPQASPMPPIAAPQVLEAVLFASDEPLPARKLAEILGAGGVKEIRGQVDALNARYDDMNCAFRIEEIAGGYQMLTRREYDLWLRQLIKVRGENKLSPAALETLAVIAYKQPVLRVDVEAVRGVGCGEMIRQLCEKGLVKIVGRAEELGRPLLYGTTRKFLETFGLGTLKDLPQASELKPPG